ncbi:MAG: TolC family protein [Candidatus Riflebacteria bacterium]|nr:TolC family protein [Candidatus Riflebacteria bacterium]
MRTTTALCCLWLCLVPPARGAAVRPASTPVKLTLREALSRAIASNPQFHSTSQLAPAARGRRRQALAALMPKVSALAFEAHQAIPDIYKQSQATSVPGGALFAEKITAQRVTLTQPLVDVGSYATSRASKRLANATSLDVAKARVDLVAQVKRAFYDLLLAGELISVQQATVEQVGRQLDQARCSERAGSAARFDVLRAEVQLANVRPQLIQATHDREIARQALANLLGIDPETPIELEGDFAPPDAPPARSETWPRPRRGSPRPATPRAPPRPATFRRWSRRLSTSAARGSGSPSTRTSRPGRPRSRSTCRSSTGS